MFLNIFTFCDIDKNETQAFYNDKEYFKIQIYYQNDSEKFYL